MSRATCFQSGARPLHLAEAGGHTDTVALLLGAGASMEVEDWQGRRPLMYAAVRGQVAAVRVLVGARGQGQEGLLLLLLHCTSGNINPVMVALLTHTTTVNHDESRGVHPPLPALRGLRLPGHTADRNPGDGEDCAEERPG